VNQKLSDWAAIAEVVSGVAVVVTLLLLFLGIRDTNRITRASMYSDVIEALNELDRDIYRDAELNELWGKFLTGQDLADISGQERLRLFNMIRVLFRNYDQAFIAVQNGVMGNSEWQRFEGPICSFFDRARDIGVNILESDNLRADFLEVISTTCGDLPE
jgi:hypothetical protein